MSSNYKYKRYIYAFQHNVAYKYGGVVVKVKQQQKIQ